VGVLVELGVTDPVPALNAPAIPQQLQQDFWGGAQTRVPLAVTSTSQLVPIQASVM
jgi:hypothetical protein